MLNAQSAAHLLIIGTINALTEDHFIWRKVDERNKVQGSR